MRKVVAIIAMAAVACGLLSAITGEELERLARAVVMVLPVEKKGSRYEPIGTSGSGTFVDTKLGVVVTNHHVVYNDDKREICRYALVCVSLDVAKPPEPAFVFEVVLADPKMDVAVLRFVEKARGSRLEMRDLPSFPPADPARWGDVKRLRLNDEIIVLGYPGYNLADKPLTLTVTNGKVSGFLPDTGFPGVDRAWIKSDALASWGNSGGTAIDSSGRFIGIPTEVMLDQKGGRLVLFRPSDMVRSYLDRLAADPAMAALTATPESAPAARPATGRSARQPTVSGIVFALDQHPDLSAKDPGSEFPAGEGKSLFAYFDYRYFPKGLALRAEWTFGGEIVLSEDFEWEWDESGVYYLSLQYQSGGLPAGDYGFELSAGGRSLGSARARLLPKGAAPGRSPVAGLVRAAGRVVTALAGRPVKGAVVGILPVGVPAQRYLDRKDDKLFLCRVVADADGRFATPAVLEPGKVYAAVVSAKGFRTVAADGAVKPPKDQKGDFPLTIEMNRQ